MFGKRPENSYSISIASQLNIKHSIFRSIFLSSRYPIYSVAVENELIP